KVRPGRPDDVVSAVQVHLEHGVPVLRRHLVEGAVAQDAGVAHHTVYSAELVERGLDDVGRAVFGGDVVVVGRRTAARLADLGDDLVGHGRTGAGAVAGPAEVVHDDAGALPGEGEGILTPQSPAGSGDDDDTILRSGHRDSFLNRIRRTCKPTVSAGLRTTGRAGVRTTGERA